MLCEFRVKNYKSFRDEGILSMSAVPGDTTMDYSLIPGKNGVNYLSSTAIYGPNASGKTNIIGALDTFKSIIIRGNIKNSEPTSLNVAAGDLELIPNNRVDVSEPVEFCIEFIEGEYTIRYELKLDLGLFLEEDYDRKVVYEKLSINDDLIFIRGKEKIDTLSIDNLNQYDVDMKISTDIKSDILTLINNVDGKDLFLMNGFRVMASQKFSELIRNWFDRKLRIIFSSNKFISTEPIPKKFDKPVFIGKYVSKVAKIFGSNSDGIGYFLGQDNINTYVCSILKTTSDSHDALPASIFESFGTVRMVNIFPVILEALADGLTLIMDEFDASIHPKALINIVEIFHNDALNVNKAQLVFNTHNPIFLNPNVFRRDEIKFVERDEYNSSVLYSMADFDNNEFSGSEDYIKNYFIGRYGAVQDIDFSAIIKDFMGIEEDTNA